MADDTAKSLSRGWLIFVLVSLYVTAQFVWRVATPAGSWPMPAAQLLSMVLDLILVVALIGLYRTMGGQLPEGDRRHAARHVLFWPALASGIGMFIIRFSSDVGWWTGHVRNWTD